MGDKGVKGDMRDKGEVRVKGGRGVKGEREAEGDRRVGVKGSQGTREIRDRGIKRDKQSSGEWGVKETG